MSNVLSGYYTKGETSAEYVSHSELTSELGEYATESKIKARYWCHT